MTSHYPLTTVSNLDSDSCLPMGEHELFFNDMFNFGCCQKFFSHLNFYFSKTVTRFPEKKLGWDIHIFLIFQRKENLIILGL